MKSAVIVAALIGLAFGVSISTKATSTLSEADEVITGTFNETAMFEIVERYIKNDTVIAIIGSLGSDNFHTIVNILKAQEEVIDYIQWVDDHGIQLKDFILSMNELFVWGSLITVPQTNPTISWSSMIDDLEEFVFTNEVIKDMKEAVVELVKTNPEFREYIRRSVGLRPLFNRLVEEHPEFKAVGDNFRDLGVDVDLALDIFAQYGEWLESLLRKSPGFTYEYKIFTGVTFE